MPRTRDLKPTFFTNEDLVEMAPLARLFYAGIWGHADRDGRIEDKPKRLKMMILPMDQCDPDEILSQLAEKNFITRYEVEGQKFIQINNWHKHQNIHPKECPSKIPPPPNYSTFDKTGKKPRLSAASNEQAEELHGEQRTSHSYTSGTSIPSGTSLPSEEPPLIPPSGEGGRETKAPKGTRLSKDWYPSQELIDWARSERPDLDIKSQIEQFRDYWCPKAGKDACKLDWNATFRNWIRNARTSSPRASPGYSTNPRQVVPASQRQNGPLDF